MGSLEIFLLMVSALVLIGSGWFIVFPESAQKTIAWWLAMPRGISYAAGVLQIFLGVAVVAEAVRQVEDVVIVAAVVIGLLFVFKGGFYFWRSGFMRIGRRFTAAHSTLWLRVVGVLGALAVFFLLFVAIRGG